MQPFKQESNKIILPPIQYLDKRPTNSLELLYINRPIKRRSFHAFEHECHCPTIQDVPLKKPRWSMEDRSQLMWAVIKDKQLDDMTTFDWGTISSHLNRNHKACKDQWRREILPLLQKLFFMEQFQE